jgi:hypothetical protein
MYRICAERNYTPFALSPSLPFVLSVAQRSRRTLRTGYASAKSKGERHERTNLGHEPKRFIMRLFCAIYVRKQSRRFFRERK